MTSTLSRRAVLAGLTGSVMASSIPAAKAADKLRVGKAVSENFGFVPLDIGIEAGIFRKENLDIEELIFTGGAKVAQAMAAGSIDISLSAGPDMAFVAKGAPEIAIASISSSPGFMGFSVGTQSTARALDDLRGTKIGVTSPGSLTDWLVEDLNRAKGWTGADRAVAVAIGGSLAADVAALKTGEVAASVGNAQLGYMLEQEKVGRLLADCAEYVKSIELFTIFASNALVRQNPEAVRRFLKGWFETVAFMKHNKAKTVEIAAKATGYLPQVTARTYDNLISEFSTDGRFKPEALETLRVSFIDMKTLPGPIDMEKLFTTAFLPKPSAARVGMGMKG
ncbi:MAG TPA: ABC transporter substrate-binding protein [Stellaceae bacterium]|nr:ABC transporter substrate-binding protein [Stellaceae bacterium]